MLDIIKEQGIVAVLRADSHEQAREYMNACVKGGIKALELTYSIPNVNELIEEYKEQWINVFKEEAPVRKLKFPKFL